MNIRMNINASRFSSRITAAVAALVAVALTSILIASGIRGDIPTVTCFPTTPAWQIESSIFSRIAASSAFRY